MARVREVRSKRSARASRFVASCFPLLGLVSTVSACGRDESSDGSDGHAGNPSMDDGPTDLRFDPATTLTLAPGEKTSVVVRVTPAAPETIGFGLIAEDPALVADAFLDRSAVTTDDDGRGSVSLTAPTEPTAFLVRATARGGLEATRAVSVSDQGFGKLRVTPSYEGERDVETFVASARVGVLCEEIEDPLTDGPLRSVASSDLPLVVDAVPAGPGIAVSVRSGGLVAGCLNVPSLGNDEIRSVTVSVADLPLELDDGALDLTFGIGSSTAEFDAHLTAARDAAVDAFVAGALDDAQLLLDAMTELVPAAHRTSFEETRDAADYDGLTLLEWSSPTVLRSGAVDLLDRAALTIAGDSTFVGRLTLNPTNALFVLESAAEVPGALSGFFVGSTWTRASEAGDELILGGALEYQPSAWLLAIARHRAAIDEEPLPEAELVLLAGCDDLGDVWTAGGATELYEGCDASCAVALCEDAIVHAWSRTSELEEAVSRLAVAMTGSAEVTSSAEVDSFQGSWLGTIAPAGGLVGGEAVGTRVDE